MKRSIGVTMSAIVVLLGSLLWTAIFALSMIAMRALPSAGATQSLGPIARVVPIGTGAVFTAAGIFGIVTAIGLFRLKRWARFSLLIFSVMVTMTCAILLLTFFIVPLPVPTNASISAGHLRGVLAVLNGIPAALGVWWLYLFNTRHVRVQFGGASAGAAEPSGESEVPLSIRVISVWMILGAIGRLFALLTVRAPNFVLGMRVDGAAAGGFAALLGALPLIAGIGLWRLRPFAYRLTIGYLIFGIVNMLLFLLLPGLPERLDAIAQASTQHFEVMQFAPFLSWSMLLGIATSLAGLAILWSRRGFFNARR